MHVLKPKNISENEQGSALVYTLMVLLLLSLLGISVGMVTVGSYRLSDSNRDYASAYYIAEAGANVAYEEIQNLVNNEYKSNPNNPMMKSDPLNYILKSDRAWSVSANGDSIAKKVYGKGYSFEGQFGSATNATVTVKALTQDNATEFIIESVGSVDQKERVVQKKFEIAWPEDKGSGGGIKVPPNAAVVVSELVDLTNGILEGGIYTNSTQVNSVEITNPEWQWKKATIYHLPAISAAKLIRGYDPLKTTAKVTNEMIDFDYFDYYNKMLKEIVAPEISNQIKSSDFLTNKPAKTGPQDSIDIRGSTEILLNGDYYLRYLKLNSTLTLNVGSSDSTLVIEQADLAGEIIVKGTGRLTIYFKDRLNMDGYFKMNEKGLPSKLTVVYLGGNELLVRNSPGMNAHFVVKSAKVTIDAVPIKGIFLTGSKNVEFGGYANNSEVLLVAPDASVVITGSHMVNGSIISENFKIWNNGQLKYKEINTEGFPFSGSGGSTEPDKELISSEPTIEPN